MDFLANELSVHGQFHDVAGFREALKRLMMVRKVARRFGREVQCSRSFLKATPMPDMSMQQAIGNFERDGQRAVMAWLTRDGPFWDDLRKHGEDDYLECRDRLVTDTSAGEAAFRKMHGAESGLVSLTPSAWCYSPLKVTWVRAAEGLDNRNVSVENWWESEAFGKAMEQLLPPPASWNDLREVSIARFTGIRFAEDCFDPLAGIPFARSAADRFLVLLGILDSLTDSFEESGVLNLEGHRILREHFTGDRAWFSDSSESEKQQFSRQLAFDNPDDPSSPLFCPWHGKVSHLTLRLHFSWPIESGSSLYVVYAGPKITRR